MTFPLTPGNKTVVKANSWQDFRSLASQSPARIILADGEDLRAVQAAVLAQREQVAVPILIGSRAKIETMLRNQSSSEQIECIDPHELKTAEIDRHLDELLQLTKFKKLSRSEAQALLTDPLILGCLMVREGKADGFVGGATRTTTDTLRAIFSVIGLAPKTSTLFGFFLIEKHVASGQGPLVLLADCAVIPQPSPKQLANIAIGAATAYTFFTGDVARVAMLSFSTEGSADHELVNQVKQAVAMAHDKSPDTDIVGEWQADAALDAFSARMKAVGNSPSAGNVNVLIAPDLNCGNIAYKLIQRLGGCRSVGPVLWGTALPANDISRGCSAEDIVDMMALTTMQVQEQKLIGRTSHGQ